MKKIDLKVFIKMALVSAIYIVLTIISGPLAYESLNFRVSEILMLLVFYNDLYIIPLIIGCLISNLFSTLGIIDILFGTTATVISLLIMKKIKNKFICSLIPSIINSIIVGIELTICFKTPFIFNMGSVFIGEFVVVSIFGLLIFLNLEKNDKFMELIKGDKNEKNKKDSI